MKQKILLSLLVVAFTVSAHAQKKAQRTTAYMITSAQKGSSNWTEVKLVDVTTGEEVQSIYQSKQEVPVLNARTKKPIVKKDVATGSDVRVKGVVLEKSLKNLEQLKEMKELKEMQDLPANVGPSRKYTKVYRFENKDGVTRLEPPQPTGHGLGNGFIGRKMLGYHASVKSDKPFATNSAACAYDKKHDRLYYTPMGINQLRYIDLKSKANEVYYFEDEAFGVVTGPWDGHNHITRMVIASDNNGYALTNNSEHLVKFSTNKKTQITDLGALADDVSNGANSIRSSQAYGGDMIADDRGDLYLISASKMVFKIDVDAKVATYKGTIQGLPRGYSTNGAIVESGTSVIVSSATSTSGYYKFDLNTMQAEKVSTGETVFNASDLANGNFISAKKADKKVDEVKATEVPAEAVAINQRDLNNVLLKNNLSIYPNPVSLGSSVKISFGEQPTGRYSIQLMDITGKLVETRQITIGNRKQVEDFRMPSLVGRGSYVVKIVNEAGKVVGINKVIVQ